MRANSYASHFGAGKTWIPPKGLAQARIKKLHICVASQTNAQLKAISQDTLYSVP